MEVHLDEIRSNLAVLPDAELQAISSSTTEEYRPEAITAARDELMRRGVQVQPPAGRFVMPGSVESTPGAKAFLAFRLVALCLAVLGLNMWVRAFLKTHDVSLNLLLPVVSLVLWGIVYFDRRRLQRNP